MAQGLCASSPERNKYVLCVSKVCLLRPPIQAPGKVGWSSAVLGKGQKSARCKRALGGHLSKRDSAAEEGAVPSGHLHVSSQMLW